MQQGLCPCKPIINSEVCIGKAGVNFSNGRVNDDLLIGGRVQFGCAMTGASALKCGQLLIQLVDQVVLLIGGIYKKTTE